MTTIIEDGTAFGGSDDADSIAVLANHVRVDAGKGDDWISAILDIAADPSEDVDGDGFPDEQEVSTDLRGDDGNDRIHASLRGVDEGQNVLSLAALLSGGAGNDQIWLDIYNYQAPFDASVSGGTGADDIRVTAFGEGDSSYGGGSVAVDAGGGDDTVLVDVGGRAEGGVTVRAGGGNDFVTASAWFIEPAGNGSGTTELYGGAGNDTIKGDSVFNNAEGGSGNDEITLDGTYNAASGGAGHDWISVNSWVGYNAIYGGDGWGTNAAVGGAGDDTIRASIDFSFSGEGNNEIEGGDGGDNLRGTITFALDPHAYDEPGPATGINIIEGGNGDDRISGVVKVSGTLPDGFDLHSELSGGAGDDRLTVKGGEGNILNGGAGDDTLIGGSGSDTLIGLQGDDALQGKGGADIFLFGFIRSGERDRIADFTIGEDVIDLSQIDANRDRAGEQSFRFGTREGTGRAWIEEDPDTTGSILYADDGHRVLEVLLKDGKGVSADDYSASDFLL